MSSPFDTSGPSQILKSLGRTKSAIQFQKDALRVNQHSDSARNPGQSGADKTARIMGRTNTARSQ
jgi:hypothetical protein